MKHLIHCVVVLAACCIAAGLPAHVIAQQVTREAQPDAAPEHKLPPGWTEADMMACVEAGTPGKMHEHLAKSVGVWNGKTKMWMGPGGEPTESECVATISSVMDGRFTKCKVDGEMPGMGPFNGFAINGYDNVAQRFQAIWIDNHSTGIMVGTGELSTDGSTMTWNFTHSCPITKKPTVMREVERHTSPDSMTLEMYGMDPKSGKEYKMMQIDYTRQSDRTAARSAG